MRYESNPPLPLFDLDELDQNPLEPLTVIREAEEAEHTRVCALPEHAQLMTHCRDIVGAVDIAEPDLRSRAAEYLKNQAIGITGRIYADTASVHAESAEFAARFFGAEDVSPMAILNAYERFRHYFEVLT